jgi:hypothetical protein
MTPSSPPAAVSAERRWALLLLSAIGCGFAAFAWFYVRRLNNYVMGDAEFTGWTAPFAARLGSGERPYVDFVLPIPPGSFALLALVQKAAGDVRLIHELGLIAVSHLLMGLLGYATAAPLTTRLNAALVAAGTLVLVIQMPKECAYDHTAQLCIWSSMALGVRALLHERGRRRAALFRVTGLVAGLCLAFKQSTATGVIVGWLLAFGYLALCLRRQPPSERSELLQDARDWGLGALAGILATGLLILAVGSSLGAFWQAVFVDGPELKGGTAALLENLRSYLLFSGTFPSGLFVTAALVGVGMRFVRFERHLHLGDEPVRGGLGPRQALLAGALLAGPFLLAAALLVLEVRELPQLVLSAAIGARQVPSLGLALACAFFVGHHVSHAGAPRPVRWRGHVINALVLVAVTSSLLHGLSFVHYFPFYNNDPLIPLAFLFLFGTLDRARLGWLKIVIVIATFVGLFGVKFNRALSADTAVSDGYWAGLRVNYRGRELLNAVRRVQESTRPDERVLMLPEDAEIAPLFGRPRPKLKGAIVFVDQYPARLAELDIAELERDPPKVIVIHPGQRAQWKRLYSTWSDQSGAERVLVHVLDRLLPARYRKDSTFRTIFFWNQGQFEVWVRRDG